MPSQHPSLITAILTALATSALAQGPVLIREVISREVGANIGAYSIPDIKEVASREVGAFFGMEPDPPFREVVSREASLVMVSPAPPPRIDQIAMTVSPVGDTVTLDWSAYNPWAVRDVREYAVYYSATGPFADVTGMTHLRVVPGEQLTTSFTALAPWQDHYFAVVAIDGFGQFDPAVQSRAAYVLMPEVVSREAGAFIGGEPEPPYREVVSREASAVFTDAAPPPVVTEVNMTVSPSGDTVTLDWSAYNQWDVRDVREYAIYYSSDGSFSDVTAMSPARIVPGEQLITTFEGLAEWQDHFFAVVPIDGLGNFEPQVLNRAAYVLMPEIVSREAGAFIGQEPPPPPAVYENLEIPNHGFESPSVSNFVYWVAMSQAQRSTFQWTGAGNLAWEGPALFRNGSAWGYQNVPQGSQGVSLQADASISQAFEFATSGKYQLSWHAASRGGQVNPYVVRLNGMTISPEFSTNNTSWTRRELTLNIPFPGSHTITFAALNPGGGDNSVGIDDISIGRFIRDSVRPLRELREVVSREASLVMSDETPPAPVTGIDSGFLAATSTSAFRAVDLDWTSYNEQAQRDVARYRVYVSPAFFTNVTGLEPYTILETGLQQATVTGFDGGAILYFAVVAEDALGNFDPVVRPFSAQSSISGLGEVLALAGTSGETTIQFSWQAPLNTADFLTGYRIHFGSMPPVDLPIETTTWSATGLSPATGYNFRITTRDPFGGESDGVSLVASTFLPNPSNVRLTAQGPSVAMLWDASQPSALVTRYDLYRASAPFTDVAAAEQFATLNGTQSLLGPFTTVQGMHYAVVAVNTLGGFRTAVTSVEATKQSQTIDFPAPAAGPLQIPLAATASSGLPVVFSASPSNVASVQGTTLSVHRGGHVNITATQAGNADYWPASATRSLRLPPVITSFTANGSPVTDGMLIGSPSVTLAVTALDAVGIAKAEVFGRPSGASPWLPWGTDLTPADGFSVTIPASDFPDGDYEVRVLVTTADGHTAERSHPFTLAIHPVLGIAFDDSFLIEGDSLGGTVTIQRARSTDLSVTLASSRPTRVNPGPPVTIPAGQTQATFTINAPQNIQIQPLTDVRITASAPGATAAEQVVTLIDDDWPFLTLSLDRDIVSESAGTNAVIATVTREPATSLPLTVELANSLPNAAHLPSSAIIPAGAASVSFPVGVIDDDIATGLRTAVLSAIVRLNGEIISQSPAVELRIIDDEGPRLELAHDTGWVLKGDSGPVTVRRLDADTTAALVVHLAAAPADSLVIPPTVTIPAGADETAFTIEAANDGDSASIPVLLSATADGLSPGQTELTLAGLALPDLVVTSITAPQSIDTEERFTVGFRLENRGAAPTSVPFVQRVFFSDDPVPGGDILLGQGTFSGTLNPGVGIDLTQSVRAPREPGTYWLVVTTDANNAVLEILETNNTRLLASPITVGAAYAAVVATDAGQVPANTPIVFTGSATRNDGSKVAHVMVNIHIRVGGTERVIAAITNSAGDFTTSWQPLPGEGGDFEIGATHPGVATAPTQDTFSILTAQTTFPTQAIAFDEGSSSTITGTLTNPTAYGLTGLSLTTINAPAGLNVQVTLPGSTLAPQETIQAGVAFTGEAGFTGNHTITLRLTTAQGITLDLPLRINVRPLVPLLAFSASPLKASALRDEQRPVILTISNNGGAATGPIDILLPDLPWLQLASPGSLESIPPGNSADVTFLLSPPANQPLTLYNGTMVIDPRDGLARSLPFEFRVVSALTGDLEVEAVDEAYFFTAAAPKVEGATVTLRDAITAEEIAAFDTPASGKVTFASIPEGWYSLEVSSPNHARWQGNLYLNAGETNFRQVFISREWVTYNWTVEEIELEDRYRITVESTFETNVPAPVVTVTPAVLDVEDLIVLGQTKVINFTIENHGLIAAENGNFSFDSHPFYDITPLVENVGQLPPKSSITIPVTVRRIGEFAEDGSIRTLGEADPLPMFAEAETMEEEPAPSQKPLVPCRLMVIYHWEYICGIFPVRRATIIPGSGIAGDCGGGDGQPWNPKGVDSDFIVLAPSQSPVSFRTRNPCDCLFFDKLCLTGNKKVKASELITALEEAISAILPPWLKLQDLSIEAGAGGEICLCCKDSTYGMSGKGEATLSVKGTVSVGLNESFSIEEINLLEWSGINLDVSATAGAKAEILGEIKLSYDKKCAADGEFCFSGGLELKTFAGLQVIGNASATYHVPNTNLRVGYTGSAESTLGISGYAKVEFKNCFDGKVTIIACASLTPEFTPFHLNLSLVNDTLDDIPKNQQFSVGGKNSTTFQVGSCNPVAEEKIRDHDDQVEDEAVPPILGEQPITEFVYEIEDFIESDSFLIAQEFPDLLPTDGVCAQVKVRLDQEAVMTRSAFRGTLELANTRATSALTQVGFDLDIRDAEGNDSHDLFNIRVSRLTGLDAIDGSGEIGPQSAGSAQWTLIPRDSAAPLEDTIYTIGGTIRYDQGGTLFSIPVTPVPITVRPDAALHLKYFHQRDVFSDDPHTDEIEPAVPYSLAVMVENRGAGAARNLTITSAQPEIVDNEKGLLIDFQVIGIQVDGQNLSPSLSANFGTIDPGERKVAKWLMTSSLQGLFIDYAATFEHLDGLGDPRISLIREVDIHEMIRMIEAPDGTSAFLVNDIADIRDLPDTVHLSDGSTEPVVVHELATFSGHVHAGSLTVTMTAPTATGWTYLLVPDPGAGNFILTSVTRSDGKIIPLDRNVWQTDRTFIGLGQRPIYENMLHLADRDSTGSYTLTYTARPDADTTPPESRVADLPEQSGTLIPVRWSGTDNTGVARYDVFVSINGGPWQEWLIGTTATSAVYPGIAGNTYDFHSVATDLAGNVQVRAASSDATTLVSLENLPPVIEPVPDQFIVEGETLTHQIHASDPDGPPGGLSYSIASSRPGITIDSGGVLRWVTAEGDGGTQVEVLITVTDSGSPPVSESTTALLTVVDTNRPPVIIPVGPQSVVAGQSLALTISANDPDIPAQTIAFALAPGSPTGATIDPFTGLFLWTPPTDAAGRSHPAGVIVTDSGNPPASALMEFAINVLSPPNRPPVLDPIPPDIWLQLPEASPIVYRSTTVHATDPDGDPLTLSANLDGLPVAPGANPPIFTTTPGSNSGTLYWDSRGAPSGTYTVTFFADDGEFQDGKVLFIRHAPNNPYWKWALDSLMGVENVAEFEMFADPDGDGLANLYEMAFLRDPLRPDHTPMMFTESGEFEDFRMFDLEFKRHRGSGQFINLSPVKSSNLLDWEPLANPEWQFFLDPDDPDDPRPEAQRVRWRFFIPNHEPHMHFRIEASPKSE